MSRPLASRSFAEGLLHACLLILGAAIALCLAVQLLERIWCWLVGAAGLIAVVICCRGLWRYRAGRW